IRSIPGGNTGCPLHQRGQAFRGRRKPAGIEVEQIECAAKTLQLNLRGLDLGFAEIVEHPGTDQAHDKADDGDYNKHLYQGEALLAGIAPIAASCKQSCKPSPEPVSELFLESCLAFFLAFFQIHDEPILRSSQR